MLGTMSYRLFAPLLAIPFLIASLLLTGCARPAAQQGPPPDPQVTVAAALAREVTEWDEFTGRLEAVNTVSIRPRVSGYVSAVRFVEGATVRRGDVLFQIDPRPFQAEVDRLRAERLRARATAERAISERERAERLSAENAMSREERERRASFADEAAAQVAAVEASLRAAELNLEFTRVSAPIDGRVGRAIVTKGNLVSSGPGEATLMTTVVSLDPVYAYFDADEQIFLKYSGAASAIRLKPDSTRPGVRLKPDTTTAIRLKPDSTTAIRLKPDSTRLKPDTTAVRMALSSEDGFPRVGRLDFLDNQLDGSRGTIRARAVFRNTDGQLTPGLFVRLRLAGTASYTGLLVQDRAIVLG